MNKFDLEDKRFHDYNNGKIRSDVPSRKGMLQDNPFRNYDTRGDYELLGYLSNYLVQLDSSKKPKLSFFYRLLRFFRYFKWSNKHFKSGGGKINDYKYYTREIRSHLNKLTNLTYLSSHEIRQLITAGLRYYAKNGWDEGPPLEISDLHRCKNLQEFYTCEDEVNFEFAKELKNLRVVDLNANDADNKRGIRKNVKRLVSNIEYLKYCLVLNLEDSFVDDFSVIPENILALSVKNSNFQDLNTLSKLKNLQYLDISDNKITSLDNIEKFKDLKVLNCCKIEFCGTDKSKQEFFNKLFWFNNLEVLVMDSVFYADYKKSLNTLPIEKIVVAEKCYFPSVKLPTFDIIKYLKIPEQLNEKITISDIDFTPIKNLFIKETRW